MVSNIDEIIQILGAILPVSNQAQVMNSKTPLLGSIPELDSMAVVNILTAIEEQYGLVIDDDEVSADIFETVGSLSRFVMLKCEQCD